MRFSARVAASKGKRESILEDAPRPTRIGFIKGILGDFVGVNRGYRQGLKQPLEVSETHKAFIALIRDEAEPWHYDNESEWAALTHHLKECEWTEFYDFVELVGALLIKKEADAFIDAPDHFKDYQTRVNGLFQEDSIGWSLGDKSELYRQVPKALAKRISATDAALVDRYAVARVHFQKALSYLHQHPLDEANSIKETISALESVARVIFPRASTLGAAIKLMRKDIRYSPHLVDALEKLYVYSNATPLVRHGHPQEGKPGLPEAELALFSGVAYIRYLIAINEGGA